MDNNLVHCDATQDAIDKALKTIEPGQRLYFSKENLRGLKIKNALLQKCSVDDCIVSQSVLDVCEITGGLTRLDDCIILGGYAINAPFFASCLLDCDSCGCHFQDTRISSGAHLRAYCNDGVSLHESLDVSYRVANLPLISIGFTEEEEIAFFLAGGSRYIPEVDKPGEKSTLGTSGNSKKPPEELHGFKSGCLLTEEHRAYVIDKLLERGAYGENTWKWTVGPNGHVEKSDFDLVFYGSLFASKAIERIRREMRRDAVHLFEKLKENIEWIVDNQKHHSGLDMIEKVDLARGVLHQITKTAPVVDENNRNIQYIGRFLDKSGRSLQTLSDVTRQMDLLKTSVYEAIDQKCKLVAREINGVSSSERFRQIKARKKLEAQAANVATNLNMGRSPWEVLPLAIEVRESLEMAGLGARTDDEERLYEHLKNLGDEAGTSAAQMGLFDNSVEKHTSIEKTLTADNQEFMQLLGRVAKNGEINLEVTHSLNLSDEGEGMSLD